MSKKLIAAVFGLSLLAAACGDSGTSTSTATTTAAPATTAAEMMAATSPASIDAADQTGDGTTVTVASIDLPSDGFIVIHADNGGSPGPILGWSDLLPAGASTDVVVTLNTAITADATVWPMAHVDANSNGIYEFMPPDVTTDVPAKTAADKVAVLPIKYTVG